MKRKKSLSYEEYLIESLKDLEEAEGYLTTALEEGDLDVFLIALQHVIQAHGGIANLAKKSRKSRSSLYKTLSKKGNPYFKSITEILKAMGMHLSIERNRSYNSHRTKAA